MKALTDKTILITGGTSRLGRAFVLKALNEGASVFLTYHQNQKDAEELASRGAQIFKLDLSGTSQIDTFATELKSKIKHLDILIHNAALVRDHTIQNLSEEDWDSVMAVNLRAPYYLTKKLLSLLFRKKGDSSHLSSPHAVGGDPELRSPTEAFGDDKQRVASKIFMITSRAAITGGFGISNYVASKAGLIGLAKSLSQELGKKQILVNAVNPGFMKSKMTESLPDNVLQQNLNLSPLTQCSNPEEVAEFLIYLSSDAMTQVTGQVFHFESRKI